MDKMNKKRKVGEDEDNGGELGQANYSLSLDHFKGGDSNNSGDKSNSVVNQNVFFNVGSDMANGSKIASSKIEKPPVVDSALEEVLGLDVKYMNSEVVLKCSTTDEDDVRATVVGVALNKDAIPVWKLACGVGFNKVFKFFNQDEMKNAVKLNVHGETLSLPIFKRKRGQKNNRSKNTVRSG